MDVSKTVLVAHPADLMFDVIEAAEHYPAFLPWCAGAVIVSRDDSEVVADIRVDYHGIRFGFRTRNPKRRPTWMAITLEHGPFRHFEGDWSLTPLSTEGCRIAFGLRYDFDSTAMSVLARPVFDRIANTLVDRFVARADAVGATSAAAVLTDPPDPPDPTATPAPMATAATIPPPPRSGAPAPPRAAGSDLFPRSDP